ncbi:MAG: M42 family metallopeptidase [Oscillospiraceae bacterium]|nr:M42 family metallopeptidase [Oscillospiraceae bacterium]
MLDLLKELCVLDGVSGNEGAVRDYIIEKVSGHADEVIIDVMGNVLVFKKGAKTTEKTLMLCAHMDEVGVIVTGITDDGYLKFAMAGGVDGRVCVGKSVTIGPNRVFGVIGCKAIHLVKPDERGKAMKTEDMYIDIGAASKEAAENLVALGDTAAFDDGIVEFGDGLIKAKAIDDRFGCAVMLELVACDLPVDCWFAFTVQEEVGLRGAHTAAFQVNPDIALIIEATTAADFPSVTADKKITKIGGGAVIPFMDGGTIYDRELYKMLTELARNNGIPWQTKNVIAGGTDAAAVQRSRAGVQTAGIAIPTRNLHSPACVGKVSDMEEVRKLVRLFVEAHV